MTPRIQTRMKRTRRGTVLIAVMVIVMLAAMVAASLLFRMRAETSAASASDRGEQAYQAAMAGVQTALLALSQNSDIDLSYDSPDLFRNQLVYDDGANKWYFTIYAPQDASQQGGTIGSSSEALRAGLIDEGGKINLLTADAETLAKLPNITAEMAANLIAYRSPVPDNQSESAAFGPAPAPAPAQPAAQPGAAAASVTDAQGAGQDYYDDLPTPYLMPHGPLSSVDELLLVKDFTPGVVYGEDLNLNGVLDPNENDGEAMLPIDNSDGRLNQGLLGLATIYSSDPDLDSTGKPRININALATPPAPGGSNLGGSNAGGSGPSSTVEGGPADMTGVANSAAILTPPPNLAAVPLQPAEGEGVTASPQTGNTLETLGLSPQTLRFIRLYLLEGNRFTHPSQLLEMEYTLKADHNVKPAPRKNRNPGDTDANDDANSASDANAQNGGAGDSANPASAGDASSLTGHKGEKITSGINSQNLALVMDRLTTKPAGSRSLGLVNVNGAPAEVLGALPGMDANLAQRIVDVRGSLDGSTKSTTAWLVTQDNLLTPEQYKQVAPRLTSRSYQYRLRCVGFGWPCGRFRVIEAVIDTSRASGKILYLRDLTRLGLPLALNPEGATGAGQGTGR